MYFLAFELFAEKKNYEKTPPASLTEAHLEPSRTTAMGIFEEIVNS